MEMDFLLDNVDSIVEMIVSSGRPGLVDFKDDLENELDEYDRSEFKLSILAAVKEEAGRKKQEHEVSCVSKGTCDTDKSYNKALFIVAQEIDKITDDINTYGEFNRFNAGFKGETFTEAQKEDIKSSLDKLAHGQQVLFEEIEELKELLYVLNRKNWLELFKGKATDKAVESAFNVGAVQEFLRGLGVDTTALLG